MLIKASLTIHDESLALPHVEKVKQYFRLDSLCIKIFSQSSSGKYDVRGHLCAISKFVTSIYHNSHST